jgi:cytochrome b pre-mRNA-processing protein 3
MREAGVGDLGVGRQVRRMAEGFVGRYGAYKAAQATGDWATALGRNLYRDAQAAPVALLARLEQLRLRLDQSTDAALLAGCIGEIS